MLDEIAINDKYIVEEEYWRILGTLLHELLHAEQEQNGKTGKNNYHNKAFRERARNLGLIVDQWGHTSFAPSPSPFFTVLEKHGVEAPALVEPEPIITKPGSSKLKLWMCSCKPKPVRVRVAISDFRARCLKCREVFLLKC
ncbi:hypothetical protein ACFL02_08235 [Planctomycetota bacterium]